MRHADPPAVAGADPRSAAVPGRRHADDDPGPDRFAAARDSTARRSRASARPGSVRARRRRGGGGQRAAGTGAAEGPHDRGRRRSRRDPRRSPQPGWPSRSAWPSATATAWCWPAHEETPAAGQPVWRDELFSTLYACPNCKIGYEELEPRTFSFNSPYGACPAVRGPGRPGGLRPGTGLVPTASSRWPAGRSCLEGGCAGGAAEISRTSPARWWPKARRAAGPRRSPNSSPGPANNCSHGDGKRFPGPAGPAGKGIRHDVNETEAAVLEAFRGQVACPECKGARLRPEARAVRIAGRAIHEVTAPDGRLRPGAFSR